jgi:hypothetical protein
MRNVMFVVLLLVVGIAGLGYYRGWFVVSTNSTDQMPSATISVDKDKFHADQQTARDDVHGAGQKVKDEVGNLSGAPKDSQRQP